MNRHDFPKIHFYDQDFVDIYNKTWSWLSDYWINPASGEMSPDGYFIYPMDGRYVLDQSESIFSSFFLVYSNRNFPANKNIDYFYSMQEADGAIRWKYDAATGKPIMTEDNPEGIGLPLFAWAEYNLYHKGASKRRIKDVMVYLCKYMEWIDRSFRKDNGLYAVPHTCSTMSNSPREGAFYPVDFNSCMALTPPTCPPWGTSSTTRT